MVSGAHAARSRSEGDAGPAPLFSGQQSLAWPVGGRKTEFRGEILRWPYGLMLESRWLGQILASSAGFLLTISSSFKVKGLISCPSRAIVSLNVPISLF